jgi:hypothetical protein
MKSTIGHAAQRVQLKSLLRDRADHANRQAPFAVPSIATLLGLADVFGVGGASR